MNLVGRTVRLAGSGVLGVLVVDAARGLVRRGVGRQGAVTATSWALLGKRRAEAGAESLLLMGADIVSEAQARIGEQSRVPGEPAVDGHEH